MRLIVETDAKAKAAQRRVWLGPNQRLRVGSTEWAEMTVRDPNLADVHFQVETDFSRCKVRDLRSPGGVFLNGERINEALLHDGDELLAGSTKFRIAIDREAIRQVVASIRESTRIRAISRQFSGEICRSGIACYREIRLSPTEIAERMAERASMYVILNTSRLAGELPEAFAEAPGIGASAKSGKPSPLRLISNQDVDLMTLIDHYWGHDVVITLFSPRASTELVDAFQQDASWFATPSILREQLLNGNPQLIQKLLGRKDALLLEAGSGEDWLVFSVPESTTPWARAGFPATITR